MNQVKIFNSISEVEKVCWDSLTKNNVYMCYEWLKTFEDAAINPVKPYYILMFDNEKLAGASVCYLELNNNSETINDSLLGRFLKIRFFQNISFLPAVVCNPGKGFGTHLIISEEINEEEVRIVQNMLLDKVENIANENKASVCFQNVMEHESKLMNLLFERGYISTISPPVNYLDIKWSSFQDYKKYVVQKHPSMKKSISRHINKNKKAGVIIEQLKDIDGNGDRLFELLEMNYRKYNRSIPLKPDFFQRVKENFGDNAVIYIATKEEKITGVNIEFRKGNEAVIAYVGIDYKYSQNDLTYFNIMYYKPINEAIKDGLKRIYFGKALYKTKSRRGCIIGNAYLFYKSYKNKKKIRIKTWFVIHRLWMILKSSKLKKLQAKTV